MDGRGGGIRTPDPLVPNQMRYQTALRPDKFSLSHSTRLQRLERAEESVSAHTK
jgi:hypothetical protein